MLEWLVIEILTTAVLIVAGVFFYHLRTVTRMVEDTYTLIHSLHTHLAELRQYPAGPAFIGFITEHLRRLADGIRRWNR